MPAEYDRCERGRHVIAIVADAPPDPRLCLTCLNAPGWFRNPQIRAVVDPGHDGIEAWEREQS